MYDLARPHITEIAGVQFAYIRFHQTHEVIYLLRSLIEKSIEWGGQLWVVDGDMHKACDNTQYSVALDGLIKHDCPRFFAAAFAREWKSQKSLKLKFGRSFAEPIIKTMALIQGDPAAPEIFSLALDLLIRRFIDYCQSNQYGYEMTCICKR